MRCMPRPDYRRRRRCVVKAPILMRPLRQWDDGRNVLLAGDAASVVAPASGEGIYYAMTGAASPPMRPKQHVEPAMSERCGRHVGGSCIARSGLLGSRCHAAFLVCHRCGSRTLLQHMSRSGCTTAEMGCIHDEAAGPRQTVGASTNLRQEHRSSNRGGFRLRSRRAPIHAFPGSRGRSMRLPYSPLHVYQCETASMHGLMECLLSLLATRLFMSSTAAGRCNRWHLPTCGRWGRQVDRGTVGRGSPA